MRVWLGISGGFHSGSDFGTVSAAGAGLMMLDAAFSSDLCRCNTVFTATLQLFSQHQRCDGGSNVCGGCGIGRGSIITGLSGAATLVAAAALAVEEASTVCDGAGLSSGVISRSVCVGGVGSGSGDNVYECVFCGVDAG